MHKGAEYLPFIPPLPPSTFHPTNCQSFSTVLGSNSNKRRYNNKPKRRCVNIQLLSTIERNLELLPDIFWSFKMAFRSYCPCVYL
jgi:hypothetical protein